MHLPILQLSTPTLTQYPTEGFLHWFARYAPWEQLVPNCHVLQRTVGNRQCSLRVSWKPSWQKDEAFIKSKLCWLYRSIAQKYLWYYDELGKVSNTPCPVMLMYSVRGVVLKLHSGLLVTTIKQPGSHAMSFHKTWNNDRTHRSQNSATLGDIFCSKPSKTARTRSHLSKFIASDIIIVFSTYANSTNCSIDEAPYNG